GYSHLFAERHNFSYFWELLWKPVAEPGAQGHTPDDGIRPRLAGVAADEARRLVLDGRLRDQHDWHLRNARRFLVRYVLFQVAILLCSVVSLVYAYQVGRRFDVIAGTMALRLMLMGLRDFLGY